MRYVFSLGLNQWVIAARLVTTLKPATPFGPEMHTLYCGVTESGKTTLAREVARKVAAEFPVVVYDPVGSATAGGGWPDSAIIFTDEEEFFDYMSRDDVKGAHVFIDEAGDLFHVGKRHNFWLLTRGRHFFLSVHLIAQRPKMIAPTARGQVSVTYAFRLALEDMREIAADMGHSGLEKISLDKGDFLCLYSGQASIKRANIFDLLNSSES